MSKRRLIPVRGYRAVVWKSARLLAKLRRAIRDRVFQVILAVAFAWVVGATLLYFFERKVNPDFHDWGRSLWNVWVILFSGFEFIPKTTGGRLVVMGLLAVGVGLGGLFTASLATLFIQRYYRRMHVSNFKMEDHLVLCNWSPRGLQWISEVHSKIITEKRPVVIIHDEPNEIELPDRQDEPAFADVYIVKGDPVNEVILRRARAERAHSVVILCDDREGRHADGKNILVCVALRNICNGESCPNIAVECRDVANLRRLKKAGADEVISSDELGLRLLARAALFHGMTHVYQELLTVHRDANEMYLMPVPPSLVGKPFAEAAVEFVGHRSTRRSCLLLGVARRNEVLLNPIDDDAGPLHASDQLVVLSRVFLEPSQPLPIRAPAPPAGP